MEDHRARRVSEAVKEELAELIGFEMDDPRLGSVNVTSAEVSSDMRTAHVKVSIEGGLEKKALEALEHARGYLKHELATRLNLRRVPELYFAADTHPDTESRIDFLLRRARKIRARD
jgi:ribosome-binding factor A